MKIGNKEVEEVKVPVDESFQDRAKGIRFYTDVPPVIDTLPKGKWFIQLSSGKIAYSWGGFSETYKTIILRAVKTAEFEQLSPRYNKRCRSKHKSINLRLQAIERNINFISAVVGDHSNMLDELLEPKEGERIEVLTYDLDGVESKYHFYASKQNPVDYDRMRRECEADGKVAWIMVTEGDPNGSTRQSNAIPFIWIESEWTLRQKIAAIRTTLAAAWRER